jgi:hypothetical protein
MSEISPADPPITQREISTARVANCPKHGGLVGQRGEYYGQVFYCEPGDHIYRFERLQARLVRPIRYPRRGYV